MAQVIAGIYEIGQQIGAGGGGVVYLGRHLRLDKQVVLKADRRTLNAKPEALRREVDLLKGLSHTYIPQVYDFVQQDGIVYTVMDFIDGESLDKILKRGAMPPQYQVIQWACQILDALCYLHSRPPHGILHGDIKPANIMLRPSGDICLIDYNIALALGENGAVKVGRSRGYASPEHYEAEFGGGTDEKATELMTDPMSSTSGRNPVMLDVRSDIYSLGATLYHLLSGQRPQPDARDVKPLGEDVCSPAVSAIIQKAMAPAPDMRYQSAEEMLTAFRSLHKRDARVRRHKRREITATVLLTLMFLAGGASAFTGLKRLEQLQTALTLAEYSAGALASGDVREAVRLALQALPEREGIFEVPATAQAQKALTDALGVYDLSDGFKTWARMELPSAPFSVEISPKGTCAAAVYSGKAAIFDLEKKERFAELPVQNSAMSDLIFLDEDRILYAGDQGVTAYDLSGRQALWTGGTATVLAVSGDKTVAAAINRNEDRAVFYRLSDGEKLAERSFDGRHMAVPVNDIFADNNDSIFSLNEDGSLLAISFSDGGLSLCDPADPEQDLIVYDESDYTHFEGGFCGKYFVFAADKAAQGQFGLIDTKEAVYMGGMDSETPFSLTATEDGIYLSNGNLLVRFDPQTLEEMELAYTDSVNITGFSVDQGYVLAATDDRSFSFYDGGGNRMSSETCEENCDFVRMAGGYAVVGNRNEPYIRIMKLESHEEAQLLSYDARYKHEEARISQDGKTAMLFDYQNFCIYDMQGNVIARKELSDPEYIYDQQFEKSGEDSWLKVIWYDGTVRRYSAKNGELLSETAEEPPNENLYEEFFTDKYRITSPLHGRPAAYDLESGKLAAELEKDSYLTYVTQVNDYIITEYISAAGERYGLLLNDKLETLARLPGLCDTRGDMAVFDYESGNLRQCRLYSLQELKALGEIYIEEKEERSDVR